MQTSCYDLLWIAQIFAGTTNCGNWHTKPISGGWEGSPAHLIASCEGGQPGQRLLPGAPDPDQQGVATVQSNDAVHTGQVLQSIVKENQAHFGVAFIILFKNFLNFRKKIFFL